MASTEALRAMDRAEWALVLLVEDIPYAWTTHRDLEGTALLPDSREVLAGLHPPDYTIGIAAHDDFQGERAITQIVVEDFDGRLAEMLGGFDGDEVLLDLSIETGDDLTLQTGFHGRHVGNEAIGSSGERNAWPAIPGWSRPRLHVGLDYELDEVAAAPVSDRPVLLEGRRVVLYKVWRDHVTYPSESAGFASWRPWSEAERIWWGTLNKAGHDVDDREWTLSCRGVWSWIYKRFGLLSQERPVRVWAPLQLATDQGSDESRVRIELFSYRSSDNGVEEVYGSDQYVTQITADDTPGVRSTVASAIAVAVAAAGPDGAFSATDGQSASMNVADGAVSVRIDGSIAPNERWAVMYVTLHEKVWASMGWLAGVQAGLQSNDEHHVPFIEVIAGAPGSGYWQAAFSTKPDPQGGVPVDFDNDGQPRIWRPVYEAGTMTIRHDPAAGPVVLNIGDDIVHHAGQLDRPPKGDPDDLSQPYPLGAGVNRQGLWLLTGPRRLVGDTKDFDEAQVVWASWRENPQEFAQVAGDPPRIIVERFLDPRDFGVQQDRLASPWVAIQNDGDLTVYARPLLRLGYGRPDGVLPDQAHIVLQRMLYATGQSPGWTGYEGGSPTLPATTNEPAFGVPGVRLDGEHEDLGCQIPSAMLRHPLYWGQIAERLPQLLREISLAVYPGVDTEQLFRGLMTPRGWGWSLEGGQYGLLDFSAPISPVGATVLTYAGKATDGRNLLAHRTKQQHRAFAPKDRYVLRYDWDPRSGDFTYESAMRSPDRGSRYRPYPGDRGQIGAGQSGSTHQAEAHGTRNPAGWRERMGEVARWYDRGQFWLKKWPVMRRPGQDLWPGSSVVVTEPRAASPDGSYGIVAALALVTKIYVSKGGQGYAVDLLVDAGSVQAMRFNAPSARARGYNPATREIHCDDDWLEIGNGHIDVAHFVEQSHSNLGGAALLQVHQWDGATWTVTATGEVEDVDVTPGATTITIVSPGLAGTYRRDDEAVVTLRPMSVQVAPWALAYFSPICDEDGEWNTPAEPGYPWA